MGKLRRFLESPVALGVGCLALLLVFTVAWYVEQVRAYRLLQGTPLPQISFDSEKWKQTQPVATDRSIRSQMIDDLLARYKLVGMDRNEIVDLLGEPIVPGDKYVAEEWDFLYPVGLRRSVSIGPEPEYLAFRLDENGRVKAYGLTMLQ